MSDDESIDFSFKPKKITGQFKAPLAPRVRLEYDNNKQKISSSGTKPFDIKKALKTKDTNKRLTLSELPKTSSFPLKSSVNKNDTKNTAVCTSISNSVRELKEMTSKINIPSVPIVSRSSIKKEPQNSSQRSASRTNSLKFATPSVNNTSCPSRLSSPMPNFKTEPQEKSIHDIEDNTIELITQNYKRCLEIQKKSIAEANEEIKNLKEIISQKDAEIIQKNSKISELEKNEEIGSYLLKNNVTEHLQVKQRVDILESGMERFQYVILKTKRLLEEAQKHKESSSEETAKLAEVILSNNTETEVFKRKCKRIVQTLCDMQNSCLLEIEALAEIQTKINLELASLKNWWQEEHRTKLAEMISQNKGCQDLISQVGEILKEFSDCIDKLDKNLSSTPSVVQIMNENYASITSIDGKLKDVVSCFEALEINTSSSTICKEILSQNNAEEVETGHKEENKKTIETQGLSLEVDDTLKSEKEALLSYICFLHTQANSPVQARKDNDVSMRAPTPFNITSQGSGTVSNEVMQPSTISLSKKRGRKLKQNKEQSNCRDTPNYSTNSRYPTRRKTRARIQSPEGNNDDTVTEAEQPKKKRKIRKLGGDVYSYELDDSDEADIPKKISKVMDAALPENAPQISVTKNLLSSEQGD